MRLPNDVPYLQHWLPLRADRPDVCAILTLPVQLTTEDAERLAGFIRAIALATDPEGAA